jgi:hypothetical protein
MSNATEFDPAELFEIDAKTEMPESWGILNRPTLRSLLLERFHLKIRKETKEVPLLSGDRLPFQYTRLQSLCDNPSEPDSGCTCGFSRGFCVAKRRPRLKPQVHGGSKHGENARLYSRASSSHTVSSGASAFLKNESEGARTNATKDACTEFRLVTK